MWRRPKGVTLKRFFMKKNIFAVCMICFLFGLSILTIASSYSSIETIVFQMKFVEIYGGVQQLLGKEEYNNFTLIKGNDDVLYTQ